MLHITNGDSTTAIMERAGIAGDLLPWRDVLHEGPVPGYAPDALRVVRAEYLATLGAGDPGSIERTLRERDERLEAAVASAERVVLWFEHDLYDQLQLVQLLDWFAAHPHPKLTLVCEAEYLGSMTPARAQQLFRARRAVSGAQLKAGSSAWGAFGSADPRGMRLQAMPALPFLAPALRRLLEELPWTRDGLSRLERQVLEALRDGPLAFEMLFPRAHHHREDPVFAGDSVVALYLERLAADGLVKKKGPLFAITERGSEAVDGKADAWAFPRKPRWLGGYEIRSGRLRWDPERGVTSVSR